MRPAGWHLQLPQLLSLATALSHCYLPPFPLHHLPMRLARSPSTKTPHLFLSLSPIPALRISVWL